MGLASQRERKRRLKLMIAWLQEELARTQTAIHMRPHSRRRRDAETQAAVRVFNQRGPR